MANTKTTATKASKILAKAVCKIDGMDPALAKELGDAVAQVMARYQGR